MVSELKSHRLNIKVYNMPKNYKLTFTHIASDDVNVFKIIFILTQPYHYQESTLWD